MGELKAWSLLFSVVDFGLTFAPDLAPLWWRLGLHWPYKKNQIALVSRTAPVIGTPESHSMYGNVTPPAALCLAGHDTTLPLKQKENMTNAAQDNGFVKSTEHCTLIVNPSSVWRRWWAKFYKEKNAWYQTLQYFVFSN